MKQYLIFLLVISFCAPSTLFAQEQTAVPFIRIHPGPNLNAMAGAFTALPTNDVFGQYFNPAQLGNFGWERNFSFQFYPTKTKWLPVFNFPDLTFRSTAFAIGFSLQKLFPAVPVSVGAGIVTSKLNLGTKHYSDIYGNSLGVFNTWESYTAYSLGLGVDYFVRFNLGYTRKNIHSKLDSSTVVYDAESFGLQLTLPLTETLKPLLSAALPEAYSPSFDFSLGLTLANHDRDTGLTLRNGMGLLPEEARMGYAFSFGLKRQYHGFDIQALKLDWSSEAGNVLVQEGPDLAFPGKIKIWDNIIQGKSTGTVAVYQGWRIKIYDTLQYSRGWFKGGGFSTLERRYGFLISSAGLLKYLTASSSSSDLKYVASHFELNYVFTRYSSNDARNGTQFQGLSISVLGF